MCSIPGVSATGAIGLGISPVSGYRRVPFPAAKATAFISEHPYLLHVAPPWPWGTHKQFTQALFAVAERSVLSPLLVPASPREPALLEPVYPDVLLAPIHPTSR